MSLLVALLPPLVQLQSAPGDALVPPEGAVRVRGHERAPLAAELLA